MDDGGSNAVEKKKKYSAGRRKIEIKPLESTTKRQVTFSKRRGGLFKNASKLCIMTGAEIGVITFSPKGTPFVFAHPSLEPILQRYYADTDSLVQRGVQSPGLCNSYSVINHLPSPPSSCQMDKAYEAAVRHLRPGRERKQRLWWEEPLDGLSLRELEEMRKALCELKRNLIHTREQLKAEARIL